MQLALLMTNEQTGKLFKEKRNSQELSRKELCLAGVQFFDCRGSPTNMDSTNTKFKKILIPPTSPQLTQRPPVKEKRNSQELSRKELGLAGVQFSNYRGSPSSSDFTSMEFHHGCHG